VVGTVALRQSGGCSGARLKDSSHSLLKCSESLERGGGSFVSGKWAERVQQSRSREEGFTLLELMIVVVIIAILAAGGVVAYGALVQRAVDSSADSFKATLETAVRVYETAEGKSPAGAVNGAGLRGALENYSKGLPEFKITSGEPGTSADGYFVQCPDPQAATATWRVWSVRNGRRSAEKTFTAEFKPSEPCQADTAS